MSQCFSIYKDIHVQVRTQFPNANSKSSCFRFTVRELHCSELGEVLGKEQ